MSKIEPINMARIEIGGGTQIRAEIDEATVKEYAEAAKAGAKLPPIVVYFDGTRYWLADGFHRYWSAARRECKQIRAEIREGTKRDALLHAVGANAEHGLRRTNEDKRRAVVTLLEDGEWAHWSNVQIAKAAGVSDPFVKKIRDGMEAEQNRASEAQNADSTSNVRSSATRTGGDGKQRPAKKKPTKKKTAAAGNGAASVVDQARSKSTKPPRNGAEVLSPKERTDAYRALGKVIRALDKLGILSRFRDGLEAIAQEVKPK